MHSSHSHGGQTQGMLDATGFGGYNTIWALHLMDEVFEGCNAENTLLVTLFFGANDAAIPLPDGTP